MMMRRLRSDLSDQSNEEDKKTPYIDIIAVGVVQFFLSILIVCYGVFLMQLTIQKFYTVKTGVWTSIVFVAATKITSPWTKSYCKYLDNNRHKKHRRNLVVTTLLLSAQIALTSFIHTPLTHILLYGLFGGVLSSLICVHLQYATAEVFQNPSQVFGASNQIVTPLSLLVMPHLHLLLIKQYGTKYSLLFLSGIVLHIIPACLLIQTRKYKRRKLCKFQTVDKLSIEMVDMNHKPVVKEMSSSSSDEDDDDAESDESERRSEANDTSTNVQMYYQNVGVKILPNIPEENEVDDEDDINEISSKRLSRISAFLQELNENAPKDDNTSVNNLFTLDENGQSAEPDEESVEIVTNQPVKRNRCFSVSSRVLYDLTQTKRRVNSFLKEHFVRSVHRTLCTVFFYPVLISSCITSTVPTIVIAAGPYLLMKNNEEAPMASEDAAFILTTFGISGLFFVTGYPVYNKCSPFKLKLLFLVGLTILGLSLYIVSHDFEYRNVMSFSLLFGLGHAIVNYSENLVYEHFFDKTNWDKLQDALEISTGYIVILGYLVIYLSRLEISDLLFMYAYWLYVFNVLLWIIAFVVKQIAIYIKNVRRYKRTRFPNYNF